MLLDVITYPFPVTGSGIAVFAVSMVLIFFIIVGTTLLLVKNLQKEAKEIEEKKEKEKPIPSDL